MMHKSFIHLGAAVLLALTASCTAASVNESVSAPVLRQDGELTPVTVSVPLSVSTKGTWSDTESERRINSADLFVFSGNTLAGRVHTTSSSAAMEVVKDRTYSFSGAVNAPSAVASLVSQSAIDSYEVPFTENTSGSFVMRCAPVSTAVTESATVQLQAKRIAAKVEILGNIGFQFRSSTDEVEKVIRSVFLMNIPSKCRMDGTPVSASLLNSNVFIDSDGFVNSSTNPLTYKNNSQESSSFGGISLYCYPNAAAESLDGSDDSVTKLVICAEIGGELNYYTIGIPGIESNKVYRISSITISMLGSEEPGHYLLPSSASFTMDVSDWIVESVSGDNFTI